MLFCLINNQKDQTLSVQQNNKNIKQNPNEKNKINVKTYKQAGETC